ncbi:EAL domain-containing protein [Brevibacillus sp. B_LB10_24]|uniref:bifunctional diguanylate cyclase/phosphodiesterase n=1 Tax=Brevibacillus sp. B_LB10_24 TaxID=3380645 RepID=UPI0038B71A08
MILLEGYYNKWIVLLSFVIAVVASYSALNLASKISRAQGRSQITWLIAGSCVMGSGVWSMHFVGMLALHLTVKVHYDIGITVLSMLASIVASFIAFYITMPKQVGWKNIGIGGFFMASGIVAMHYTGMSAMQLPAQVVYDSYYWCLSVLIAFAASYSALLLFLRFRHTPSSSWWKWTSAVVMGTAIFGMHYTAMKSSQFWCVPPVPEAPPTDEIFNPALLAGVTVSTFFILMVSLGAMYFDRHVLEKMAYRDQLTGLPNRYELNRYFDEVVEKSKEAAVLFIDLDQFKTINDTLGHDIGDLLVQEAGRRLQLFLNEKQQVFRLGGDEFLVVANECGRQQAEELASRILETIKKPYHLEGNELYITASVGVSLAPLHGSDRGTLLKRADTAMYTAKGSGKNRYRLFDTDMDQRLIRRMELEKDLRKALEHGEFYLVYQPKWNVAIDQPVGWEALMRWRHPKLGIIAPGEFIPIAEETGAINAMTRWVLEEACRQNKAWKDEGLRQLPVSVNLPVHVFESQNLFNMVRDALNLTGLSPALLELEITETIVLYDVADINRQLQEVKALGVRISLDDFGSGYSSLGTIDQIPIDTLKIDRHLIDQDSPSKRAIARAIITMASQLELELVAEGVESEDQIQFLRTSGCNIMQGFYYGKPMEPSEIETWLVCQVV